MIQLFYIGFCVGLAYWNYERIIQDKVIHHWLNAVLHLLFWAWVWFTYRDIVLLLMMPFLGRLFFDTSLNLFRGKPLDYVPLYPKSWVDKAEKKLFEGDGLIPKVFYLIILIVLNIIFYA